MLWLKRWSALPDNMQNDAVRPYYDILKRRQFSIFAKRIFDIVASLVLIVLCSPLMAVVALAVRLDSKGAVIYKQIRVTTYGRHFTIYKFRSMVSNADKLGTQVTIDADNRITRVGKLLRDCRLDELPQLFNILSGDMSFVGTRPEVVRYVERYSPVMLATLLMPAGVTSEASILYKDESSLLSESDDTENIYIEKILPEKMYFNLRSLERFGFWKELGVMIKTVFTVLGVDYTDEIDRRKPPFA